MKLFKKILPLVLIFCIGSMQTKIKGAEQPIAQPDQPIQKKGKSAAQKPQKPKEKKDKKDKAKSDKSKSDKAKSKKSNKAKSDKAKSKKQESNKAKSDKAKSKKSDKSKSNKSKSDKSKSKKQKSDKAKSDKAKPIAPSVPAMQPVIAPKPIQLNKQNKGKNNPAIQMLPDNNEPTTNNVCMFLDPLGSETIKTKGTALFNNSLVVLYQKAAPIILSSDVFEIMLAVRQKIGDSTLQQFRTMPPQEAYHFALNLCHQNNISVIRAEQLMLLANVDFYKINYYYHKSESLVLLIPQEYITINHPKALNINEQATACGFNINVLNPITDSSLNNLIQQLPKKRKGFKSYGKFITNLTAMFLIQKKAGELINPHQNAMWLIYLNGHGKHSLITIGDARSKTKITQEKSSWPDSQLLSDSGEVAGLQMHQFKELIEFFSKNLNIAYLHYDTCFAGGSNQSFINETLSSLNVNFIVSSEGVDEKFTYETSGRINMESNQPGLELKNVSFINFFKLLRMFFTNPEEYIKSKEKRNDPIIKIIRTITSGPRENQPAIRFPGAGFFVPTPLNKKTKILTQTIVRAHEIENKSIDVSNSELEALIIQTPRINVPLNLGRESRAFLVMPSPKNVIPSYESIHTFKEIHFEDTFQTLLFNLCVYNARLYKQTVIIKKLTGIWLQESHLPPQQNNSQDINNVIIKIEGIVGTNRNAPEYPAIEFRLCDQTDIRPGTIGLRVNVSFELGEHIYRTVFTIKDFTDIYISSNLYVLYKNIFELPFYPVPQGPDMDSLVKQLLKPEEIAQLRKPITLESIATFIDKKIDKQDQSMAIWSEADEKKLLESIQKKAQQQK